MLRVSTSSTILDPDTYQVFEHQPAGYKQGMDMVGTIGGATVGQIGGLDLLSNITITSGANGIEYDFCEYLPGSISGYVFQDGPPIVLPPGQTLPDVDTIRTGVRTPTDKPIAGVTLALYDEAGNVVLSDSGQPLTAVTDGNGFYQFTDLDDGTYIVREFQPAGYIDGIDTQGSTGGVPINHNTPSTSIPPLPFDPNFDAIVSISIWVAGKTRWKTTSAKLSLRAEPFHRHHRKRRRLQYHRLPGKHRRRYCR